MWYAPAASLEMYEQANACVIRPWQTAGTLVAPLAGRTVERVTCARRKTRDQVQGILLSMFKQQELDFQEVRMDEELRANLDAMRREINGGQERVLNRLGALEQDFIDTKGFLAGDAIVSGRRWMDLGERLSRLERGQER